MLLIAAFMTAEIQAYISGPSSALDNAMFMLRIVHDGSEGWRSAQLPPTAQFTDVLGSVIGSTMWAHWSSTWPLHAAVDRLTSVLSGLSGTSPRTVDIVVSWCNEDLSWLIDLANTHRLDMSTNLHVIAKCEPLTDLPFNVTMRLDAPELKTDECGAYLSYLADYDFRGDYVMFLQGDAPQHAPRGLIGTVIESILADTWTVDYLSLGNARQIQAPSACRDHLLERYGLPAGPVGSYCCAQFVVSRDMLRSRSQEFYERIYHDVIYEFRDGLLPSDKCFMWPGRSTHCLWLEQLWHVVFHQAQ